MVGAGLGRVSGAVGGGVGGMVGSPGGARMAECSVIAMEKQELGSSCVLEQSLPSTNA